MNRIGGGVEGHGTEYLPQNHVIISGDLDTQHLKMVQSTSSNKRSLYPKSMASTFQRIDPNDFVVSQNVDDPDDIDGSNQRLYIHSNFNGEGVEEINAYPDRIDLQLAAVLKKWKFVGISNEGKDPKPLNDVGKQENLGVIVAGTTAHMAHEPMSAGMLVYLRLPRPDELLKRRNRDATDSIKLIPTVKSPETVWKLVSDSVKTQVYDIENRIETRMDRALRKINPSLNAAETFADTVIIFGLEFLKVLVTKGILEIEHPDKRSIDNQAFSFQGSSSAEAVPLKGTDALLGLAKAFGIIPHETKVPGVALSLEQTRAYHKLRKLMTAMAFYDGETIQHAFHYGIDSNGWNMNRMKQTPAQHVTQAQLNAPRNLIAAVDDLIADANKWCIGTCIQGASPDYSFRLILKG